MMQPLKQSNKLIIFTLKREKLKLSLWLVGCLSFVLIGIIAYVTVYSDPVDRQAMSAAMSNPAMEALFGKAIGLNNYTIGAMYSHTMTVMTLSLISISTILLVIRNTRLEEEEGMLEMFRALPTGKLAHTTSALTILVLYNFLIALLTMLVLSIFGDDSMGFEGTILTGAMYGSIGLFFGAIALLLAQLSSNTRSAAMSSFMILGLSYILRIVGDTSVNLLSWISPLGLLYQTKPFVTNEWNPVLWINMISAMVIGFSFYLQSYRDLGSGLLPVRTGRDSATRIVKTLPGFILKLLRTPLIVWTASLFILGLTYGSVIGEVESLIAGNEVIEQIIAADPEKSMVNQFIRIIIGLLSIAVVIPVVQILMKLNTEEKKGRVVYLLIGKHSRNNLLGIFVLLSFIFSILIQALQISAFAGAVLTSQVEGLNFLDLFISGLTYLPAIWIMIGLTVVLFGWFPKVISSIWALLGFSFIILYFSNLFEISEWVKGVSPFYHIPENIEGEVSFMNFVMLSFIAVILLLLGFIGYNRRDTQT